jgi:hypothetical protein
MGSAVGLFQTYHQRENVITDNVVYFLKMIQRLDGRSYDALLVELFGDDESQADFDDVFELQPANLKTRSHSVPDACIERDSYKIVVETKGNGAQFREPQLKGHMEYLTADGKKSGSEYKDHRLLLTLDINAFPPDLREETNRAANDNDVRWTHLTFAELATLARQACSDTTNEILRNILDEFDNYLDCENLIPSTDVIMKMVLAGKAHQLNENVSVTKYGVYFHPAERRGYSFNRNARMLGMYWQKSIRAIARIQTVAKMVNGDVRSAQVEFQEPHVPINDEDVEQKDGVEDGSITATHHLSEDQIAAAAQAVDRAERECGWNLRREPYYIYLTEPFVETDFPKTSPRAPFGVRLFNLDEELHLAEGSSSANRSNPTVGAKDLSTHEIAKRLRTCSWR